MSASRLGIGHDTERMEQLVSSSNYSFQSPGMSPINWNATKQFLTALWSAFPDLYVIKSKTSWQMEIKSQFVSLILALTRVNSGHAAN